MLKPVKKKKKLKSSKACDKCSESPFKSTLCVTCQFSGPVNGEDVQEAMSQTQARCMKSYEVKLARTQAYFNLYICIATHFN